jgi:gas vesicle protein
MENKMEGNTYKMNGALKIVLSVLIGGLVGATTMLIFAPQSGKRTRAQIKNETVKLRDRTSKGIKKTVAQVRSETNRLATGVSEKAVELKQLGQETIVKQLDRVTSALNGG